MILTFIFLDGYMYVCIGLHHMYASKIKTTVGYV